MTRILYSLSGEGFGHATRSHVFLKELSKKHKIKIVCGGKGYEYLSNHFKDIEKIRSLRIIYKKNKVASISTLFNNIPRYLNYFSYRKIKRLIDEFKPDVIINDFENFTSWVGRYYNIPIISIGNHHVISNAKHKFSFKFIINYIQSRGAIDLITPHADYFFVTSFFKPTLKKKYKNKTTYIPIVVRDEIKKLKPANKGYVLVYQTSDSNSELLRVLKTIKQKFVIYGFNVNKIDENLEFKSFNEKQVYKDLANCKAVITNGGFSLMSEALYLKKPIFSEPVKHQFEQILNAIYLERKGYGMFVEKTSKKNLEKFLSSLDKYKNNLKKLDNKRIDKEFSDSIKHLNRKIEELKIIKLKK